MGCPASTRLMRRSSSGQQTVILSPTSSLVVPYSPTRVALVIGCPVDNAVYLSLRSAAEEGTGIFLPPLGVPLVLNLGDHGALVMGPIYGAAADAGTEITYWDSHVETIITER